MYLVLHGRTTDHVVVRTPQHTPPLAATMAGPPARTLLQWLGLHNRQGPCGAFFDGLSSGLAEPLQVRLADPPLPTAVPAQPLAAVTLGHPLVRRPG